VTGKCAGPIAGGIADAVSITPAGYLTEYETKISMSDFRHDAAKDKWNHTRAREVVSRFFYVVPLPLVSKIQPLLQPGHGLISVHWSLHHWSRGDVRTEPRAREIVAAKRLKAEKVSDKRLSEIYRNCYFRHWSWAEARMQSALALPA
jgi:hypothetical protein